MKVRAGLTERKIKTMLVQHLRDTGAAQGARLISELCVAGFTRRADVVLVNGKLSAFEIKGDFDKLNRLAGQVETFSRYFESLTVVCAERHTSTVLATVPQGIGVWEVNSDQIAVKRKATVAANDEHDIWLSFLPVRVLRPFLSEQGISPRGHHRKDLLDAARGIEVSAVRQAVLNYLKVRGQAPSGFRVHPQKVGGVDPVRANDIRVQEYLSLMREHGGAMRAIPRRAATSA